LSRPPHLGPRRWRQAGLATLGLLLLGLLASAGLWAWHRQSGLIRIHHAPAVFARRVSAFTVNVTGELAAGARGLAYRLNDGPWREVGHRPPRAPFPAFTIELPAAALRDGENRLELRARGWWRPDELRRLSFTYDPAPIVLPIEVDWSRLPWLDVQDGRFEVTPEGRLRPIPGHEGFDRTVAVTGAFPGGRRVTVDVVFRDVAIPRNWRGRRASLGWGFGVFPLWGGQPDPAAASPRRGWRYSALWYFDQVGGVGCEMAERIGDAPPRFVSMYHHLELVPDVPYRLVTETWPETTADGRHVRHRQRCKWWRRDQPEPEAWTWVADDLGAPLPRGEYAVAVFAHRAQVEFGPVRVEPLPPGPVGEATPIGRQASASPTVSSQRQR
jgi:hypothetical protein